MTKRSNLNAGELMLGAWSRAPATAYQPQPFFPNTMVILHMWHYANPQVFSRYVCIYEWREVSCDWDLAKDTWGRSFQSLNTSSSNESSLSEQFWSWTRWWCLGLQHFAIWGWNRELHKDSDSGTIFQCCHLGPTLNLYNYELLIAENKTYGPGSKGISREMRTNGIVPRILFPTNNWAPNGIDDSVH